jgi:hypothetical protein
LVVEGAVTHPALLVCEHGLSKRMPRFIPIESCLTLLAELLGFEPVEGEQGALDPLDLASSQGLYTKQRFIRHSIIIEVTSAGNMTSET